MPLTNPMGDFEITDPAAMRALAHPTRLAVLTRLQRYGPATATQLAPHVGASPSVTSWHLRHLAGFGLVLDYDGSTDGRQRWWQAVARGFRFAMPDDDEGQAAYRALSQQMLSAYDDLPRTWAAHVEPHLPPTWRTLSGTSHTRLTVTVDELAEIELAIDELLGRYVQRPAPAEGETRPVRFLRYLMPEADDNDATDGNDSTADHSGRGSADDHSGSLG